MKRTLNIMIVGIVLAGIAISAEAKREKKNEPKDKRFVIEILEGLGEEHFPKGMKVRELGSLKTETTYYHIYSAALKGGYEYRVIVFDNTPEYIGYYTSTYEPSGYEDGKVLLDLEDGTYADIEFSDKGPQDTTRVNGISTKFMKAPEKTKEKFVPKGKERADGVNEPEYRIWKITLKGKEGKVRAIYLSQDFGNVTLRAEASGTKKAFPISSISKEDKEYIKQYK